MKAKFIWNDLEEGLMIEAVKEATSVRVGLQNAAKLLETTFFICRNRWYSTTVHKLTDNEEVAVALEVEVVDPVRTVGEAKDSVDDFLSGLSDIMAKNKRLLQENIDLRKDNRLLVQEKNEIKEAYDYMLKVMDKARKMCLEDEDRPQRLKYSISQDGSVQTAM